MSTHPTLHAICSTLHTTGWPLHTNVCEARRELRAWDRVRPSDRRAAQPLTLDRRRGAPQPRVTISSFQVQHRTCDV